MSARRYTVETLKSGQERAYGPTIIHVRASFEVQRAPGHAWEPFDIVEDRVRERLKGLGCGFTEFQWPTDRPKTESEHFATRLIYLRKISPGVWEFKTKSEYTG